MNRLQELWTEFSLESLQKKTPLEIQNAIERCKLKQAWLELEQNGEEDDGTD